MKITFKKSGGIIIIMADATPVGQIKRAYLRHFYVLSFRNIGWANQAGHNVVKQISHLGLSTIDSDQKLRPQAYGQGYICVQSVKLAKYIAEQVAMGNPHMVFGRKL